MLPSVISCNGCAWVPGWFLARDGNGYHDARIIHEPVLWETGSGQKPGKETRRADADILVSGDSFTNLLFHGYCLMNFLSMVLPWAFTKIQYEPDGI